MAGFSLQICVCGKTYFQKLLATFEVLHNSKENTNTRGSAQILLSAVYNFTSLKLYYFSGFEVLEVNHAQKYLQTARTSFEQGTAISQASQAAPRRSS